MNEEKDKTAMSKIETNHLKDDSNQLTSLEDDSITGNKDSSKECGAVSETLPIFQYSKKELTELQQHPDAQKRPDCLSHDFDNAAGIWNPERWFMNKRRGDSPIDESKFKRDRSSDIDREMLYKRRSSDPKERIREGDDIVLSPQRRSFGIGCHVMQPFLARRPNSPIDSRENENHREPNRRIGSGRIVRRDVERERNDYNRNRDRYEREGDGRFDNRDRYNRERSSKGKRDYGERRSSSKDHNRYRKVEEEDEPEWFSGGPSSQSETIELRGFESLPEEKFGEDGGEIDDEEYDDKHKIRSKSENMGENNGNLETNSSNSPEPLPPPPSRDFETLYSTSNHEFDFDEFFKLDQPVPSFLNSSFINPSQGSDSSASVSGSRFSRWFQKESPIENHSPCHSQRSSGHDDLLNHRLADDMSFMPLPSSENHSHEPIIIISPPHQTEQGKQQQHQLLDMLQRPSQVNGDCDGNLSTEATGGNEDVMKNKSLAELEAGLKQLVLGNNRSASPPNNKVKDQDMSAFNKLLGQAPDGFPGHLPKDKIIHERDLLQELLKTPPVKITQPSQSSNITKNVLAEQDILLNLHKHQPHPPPPPLSPQPNLMQLPPNQVDLLAQILRQQQQQQQQNDHLNRLFGQLSPNHSLRNNFAVVAAANNRQEILAQILKQGQLDQNLLLKQQQQPTIVHRPPTPPLQISQLQPNRQNIKSPNTLSVFDVMQQNILSRQQASSPRIPSPIGFSNQPPILSHAPSPIHPQLSTSPIPSPQPLPVPQTLQVTQNPPIPRVLSPQDLINHTKNILYNALVKKQLKEQKETFRKRQELQRARSPNTAITNSIVTKSDKETSSGNMGSPSKQQSISTLTTQFTPTSVMKKMHSAKLDDKDSPTKDGKSFDSPDHKVSIKASDNLISSHNVSLDNSITPSRSPAVTPIHFPNMNSTCNVIINPPLSSHVSSTANSTHHLSLSPRPQSSSPRPVHGQGIMSLPIRTQAITTCPNNIMQGRPIVKGSQGNDGLLLASTNKGPASTSQGFSIPNQMMQTNKLYGGPPATGQLPRVNQKELNTVDVNKLLEQQRLLQQTAQRQLSTSPMNPSSATHPAFPVSMTGRTPMHSGIIRPGVATPQATMLFRNMVHPGTANQLNQHQLNTLNQLAALQQRGFDPRQLQARGLHPMAIQQLLYGPRTNTNTAGPTQQTQNSLGINVGVNHFGPAPPLSPQTNQLKNDNSSLSHFSANHNFSFPGTNTSLSGQINTGRQSPVNLSKWFGNELLKQQLPDLPPLPAQKALSVEELERRQQAVGN